MVPKANTAAALCHVWCQKVNAICGGIQWQKLNATLGIYRDKSKYNAWGWTVTKGEYHPWRIYSNKRWMSPLRLYSNKMWITPRGMYSNKRWLLHCLSIKFPPLNSPQLCQILTDFQNCCTARKCVKFATKLIWHYPPHLRHVTTLPREIKIKIFCRYSADIEANANKLHFRCTDFNSSVTVYVSVFLCFLSKIVC